MEPIPAYTTTNIRLPVQFSEAGTHTLIVQLHADAQQFAPPGRENRLILVDRTANKKSLIARNGG